MKTALICSVLAHAIPAQAAAAEERVAEGRIVNMLGDGVPAASVRLHPWPMHQASAGSAEAKATPPLAEAVTDGEGFYRFRYQALPVGRAYILEVLSAPAQAPAAKPASQAYCRLATFTFSPSGGDEHVVHDAAIVSGTLVDADGAALASVEVFAQSRARPLQAAQTSTTTDEAGAFALAGVALGPTSVAAYVPGRGLYVAELDVVANTTIELEPVEAATTSLTIEVEGAPSDAGLFARIAGQGRYRTLPPALTTPRLVDGRCSFDALPDQKYRIDMRYATTPLEPNSVRLKAGTGPHHVRFAARPPNSTRRQVQVRIVDMHGAPAADIPLTLASIQARDQDCQARTDASGTATFSTRLAIGSSAFVHVTTGSLGIAPKGQPLKPSRESFGGFKIGEDDVPEFVVAPTCTVVGRAVQQDGSPAALANGRWLRLGARPARGGAASWLPVAPFRCDRDGRYRIPGLFVGSGSIRLELRGRTGVGQSDAIELGTVLANGTIEAADLELQAPTAIDGQLVDADGKPVVGACLRLRSNPPMQTVTNRNGRFRFVGSQAGSRRLEQVTRSGTLRLGEVTVGTDPDEGPVRIVTR
ncbi:MAG: carboxypeptidase-like regulatory domain-containing protein [Planctomycetota bacterium]